MSQRYPRSIRLTKTREFSAVFAYRCVTRSSHFSVFVKPNASTVGRLGITVGRRIASKAVDRNLMKRIVREIFRHHSDGFAGLDVIVRAQQSFPPDGYDIIESELLATLIEARRKCPTSS